MKVTCMHCAVETEETFGKIQEKVPASPYMKCMECGHIYMTTDQMDLFRKEIMVIKDD